LGRRARARAAVVTGPGRHARGPHTALHRAYDARVAAIARARAGAVTHAGCPTRRRRLGRAAIAGIRSWKRGTAGALAARIHAGEAGRAATLVAADAFHAEGGPALRWGRAGLSQLFQGLVGHARVAVGHRYVAGRVLPGFGL